MTTTTPEAAAARVHATALVRACVKSDPSYTRALLELAADDSAQLLHVCDALAQMAALYVVQVLGPATPDAMEAQYLNALADLTATAPEE